MHVEDHMVRYICKSKFEQNIQDNTHSSWAR